MPTTTLERVLAEVARASGDGARPLAADELELMCKIVRDAALAEALRATRGIGPRLRRLGHLNVGCTKVPELLGKRSEGRLSGSELAALHHRLDRCTDCARLAARLTAAEWRFCRALAPSRGRSVPLPSGVAGAQRGADPIDPESARQDAPRSLAPRAREGGEGAVVLRFGRSAPARFDPSLAAAGLSPTAGSTLHRTGSTGWSVRRTQRAAAVLLLLYIGLIATVATPVLTDTRRQPETTNSSVIPQSLLRSGPDVRRGPDGGLISVRAAAPDAERPPFGNFVSGVTVILSGGRTSGGRSPVRRR